MQSPAMENSSSKAEFRKPASETASRKYRRRSSLSGSSSSDGSPKQDRSSSPNLMREDASKDSESHPRRKDDERDLNRDSSQSHHSRRYSDRKSFRSSHGYSRHGDYVRYDKHTNEEKDNQRLSSRSGRESKGGAHYNYTRRDSEHFRSRDYSRDVDKNSRGKYDDVGHRSRDGDPLSERHGSGRRHGNSEEIEKHRNIRDRDGRDEKRDYIKSSGDYNNGHVLSHEEARGNRYDSFSGKDETRLRSKEVYKGDWKELGDENLAKGEKKYDGRETNWDKGHYGKDFKGKSDGKGVSVNENQESPAKKAKLSKFGKEVSHEQDAGENQSSLSKQEEPNGKMILGQDQSGDADFAADFSAAKVAAMKAAELVNKNIVGVGYMTADQKKKLLWGNKKSTVVEESGHQWDSALFTDRERQEKFNKLMSLRLPWCLWPIVGCEGRLEDGAQTGQSRWRRTSSCREAKGTPDGFRKAVHCWTSEKRWSHCWIRSLSIRYGFLMCFGETVMRNFVLCCTSVALDLEFTLTFSGLLFYTPPPLKTKGLWLYVFMKVKKPSDYCNFVCLLASYTTELESTVTVSVSSSQELYAHQPCKARPCKVTTRVYGGNLGVILAYVFVV